MYNYKAQKKWRDKNPSYMTNHWQTYYKNNRERLLAEGRVYYLKNKDKKRNRDLQRKFGISQIDYLSMLTKQNGRCAVCNRDRKSLTRDLAVDHDHRTKQVRALLCGRCNLGLAFLENRQWNKAAHSYLEVYSNHA